MNRKLVGAWRASRKFAMRFGNRSSQFMVIIGGGRPLNLNEVKAVEEAVKNSAAVATVSWIQRNFPEAPVAVGRYDRNDVIKVVKSPMLRLMKKPNSFYSGLTMMKAVLWDYCFSGNGYILKVRSQEEGGIDGRGRVIALWWVPSFTITPVNSETNDRIFIDHYEYTVNGKTDNIDPRDVIHFRDGFDTDNPMLGMSKFRSLLKEVCSDNEAGLWTWALLKNMGVPGVVISPGKDTEITPEDAEEMKNNFVSRFTGANRGMPLITSGPVEVKTVQFDPKQMDLRSLRQMAEERMTAVVGLPAVVVGLGAGLVHSTFANFSEAREAAYESCMIPIQQDLAETLELQLLPEFHNPENYTVFFDISKVRVLQPDINAHHVRVRGNLLSGLITLNMALIEIGREPEEGGNIRFIPNGVTITRNEDLVVQLPAPGNVPTDTGDSEDDINGNPEGGAPEKFIQVKGMDELLAIVTANGMKNGTAKDHASSVM